MREIQTEIEISASLNTVWDVITDIGNWKEWSPIIVDASGASSPGSKLSITMIGEDGKDGPKYMPVITNNEKPNYFRWRAKMMAGFLFTNDKIFELEETDSGTLLTHKEAFGGILVPMFWSKLKEHVPSMLNSMNEALKIKIENSSSE